MAVDSRNPGVQSSDARMTTVSFRVPVWLKDELKRLAERQLSDPSALFRQALLLLLKSEKDEAAS